MHLIDFFVQLIGYVELMVEKLHKDQPSYEQVREEVIRLLAASESAAKKGQAPPDEYDQARFAVCAWIDETLLSSTWTHRNVWQREQLQRLYYNTTDAGVEVFDRLNSLRLDQRDLREVYYLCLSLGFKGRFINQGDDFLLDQLRGSNLKVIAGGTPGMTPPDRAELFPEGLPLRGAEIQSKHSKFRYSIGTVIAVAAPLLLIGILYLIFRFTLAGVVEKIS
jgi:type VI secretion system protein ImpK